MATNTNLSKTSIIELSKEEFTSILYTLSKEKLTSFICTIIVNKNYERRDSMLFSLIVHINCDFLIKIMKEFDDLRDLAHSLKMVNDKNLPQSAKIEHYYNIMNTTKRSYYEMEIVFNCPLGVVNNLVSLKDIGDKKVIWLQCTQMEKYKNTIICFYKKKSDQGGYLIHLNLVNNHIIWWSEVFLECSNSYTTLDLCGDFVVCSSKEKVCIFNLTNYKQYQLPSLQNGFKVDKVSVYHDTLYLVGFSGKFGEVVLNSFDLQKDSCYNIKPLETSMFNSFIISGKIVPFKGKSLVLNDRTIKMEKFGNPVSKDDILFLIEDGKILFSLDIKEGKWNLTKLADFKQKISINLVNGNYVIVSNYEYPEKYWLVDIKNKNVKEYNSTWESYCKTYLSLDGILWITDPVNNILNKVTPNETKIIGKVKLEKNFLINKDTVYFFR